MLSGKVPVHRSEAAGWREGTSFPNRWRKKLRIRTDLGDDARPRACSSSSPPALGSSEGPCRELSASATSSKNTSTSAGCMKSTMSEPTSIPLPQGTSPKSSCAPRPSSTTLNWCFRELRLHRSTSMHLSDAEERSACRINVSRSLADTQSPCASHPLGASEASLNGECTHPLATFCFAHLSAEVICRTCCTALWSTSWRLRPPTPTARRPAPFFCATRRCAGISWSREVICRVSSSRRLFFAFKLDSRCDSGSGCGAGHPSKLAYVGIRLLARPGPPLASTCTAWRHPRSNGKAANWALSGAGSPCCWRPAAAGGPQDAPACRCRMHSRASNARASARASPFSNAVCMSPGFACVATAAASMGISISLAGRRPCSIEARHATTMSSMPISRTKSWSTSIPLAAGPCGCSAPANPRWSWTSPPRSPMCSEIRLDTARTNVVHGPDQCS